MAKPTKTRKTPEGSSGEVEKAESGQKVSVINLHQAPSVYSSFAQTKVNPLEIKIKFFELLNVAGNEVQLREVVNIIMAPGFAKAAYELLGRAIKTYEEKHGASGPTISAGVEEFPGPV